MCCEKYKEQERLRNAFSGLSLLHMCAPRILRIAQITENPQFSCVSSHDCYLLLTLSLVPVQVLRTCSPSDLCIPQCVLNVWEMHDWEEIQIKTHNTLKLYHISFPNCILIFLTSLFLLGFYFHDSTPGFAKQFENHELSVKRKQLSKWITKC